MMSLFRLIPVPVVSMTAFIALMIKYRQIVFNCKLPSNCNVCGVTDGQFGHFKNRIGVTGSHISIVFSSFFEIVNNVA